MNNHISDDGKMPPWANEPTPVSDEQKPQSMGINRNVSRNLERRMRAAERLLADKRQITIQYQDWYRDADKHLEAAQKEDDQ